MKPSDTERYKPWLSLQGTANLVQRSLGDDKNEASEFLIRAATGITEAATKISETVPTILGNKLGSNLANNATARKAIAKLVEPALKRATDAGHLARTAVDNLVKRTDPAAPTDLVGAVQHQEVRAALAKMSTAERNKALTMAVAAGDETFLAAATSGSPTLSGLTAEEQQAYRQRWRAARHPDTAARIARLSNGIMQLERIAPMLGKWSASLVEEPNAAAVAAAEATATRAKAVSG